MNDPNGFMRNPKEAITDFILAGVIFMFLFWTAMSAFAEPVAFEEVRPSTPVNTNLISAALGEGLSLSNGVLSATGGGGVAEEHDPVWAAEKGNYVDVQLFNAVDAKATAAEAGAAIAMGNADAALALAGTKADAADLAGYLPLNNPWIVFDDSKVLMDRLGFNGTEKEIFAGQNGIYYSPFAPTTGDDEIAVKGDIPDISPLAPRQWVLDTIGGTNTWMAIDGEELTINTSTNAASTNVLWQSSSGIGAAVSNLNNKVTQHTTQIAALQARPDLTSWGDYAPDGTPNPDKDAMLFINKAMTLMGSGFSWATSGSYACLCQSGAVAFQTATNGEIRIGTDVTTNYFGIVQGGSVTVGCQTDGISVHDDVVELVYSYGGGAFPIVWFTGDLIEGEWTETTPVWVDNANGTATATLDKPSVTRGFYKATSTRETGAMFRSNVPAYFPSGIIGNMAASPVVFDSVITIQANGHTYRIPAELVE